MPPGIGLGLGVNKPKFISGDPPILSDGNTVAWFDSDLQYITKDGSDFVSQWDDRSGNTNHLLQAVGTNQPLWTANGVLYDSIDNFMKCVAFTYNQPEQIYMVVKQVAWGTNNYLIDGNANSTGLIFQRTSTPNLEAYGGVFSGLNGNLAIGSFGIIRLLFNGVSSKFQINETAAIVGDFGASNMGGFTMGSQGDGTGEWSNIQVKEAIDRNIVNTAPNDQIVYDYLAAKYSI